MNTACHTLVFWCYLVAIVFSIAVKTTLFAADPTVANVRAAQKVGTKQVEIYYDITGSASSAHVSLQASSDGGLTYAVPVSAFSGDIGSNIPLGRNKKILWNAGVDWNNRHSNNMKFRVAASDPASLQSGLVAHYPFDGNILDISGNAHHATANGSITFEQGMVGPAASFFLSWLQIPNVLNDLESFSISLWANEKGMINAGPGNAESGGEAYIWFGDHQAGWAGIASWGGDWAHVGAANVAIEAGVNSTGGYPESVDKVNSKSEWRNHWHHYALTFDSLEGVRSLFIDGVLINRKVVVKSSYMGPGTIASHTWDTGTSRSYRLLGLIDEVRIYDRPLGAAEIQVLRDLAYLP